MRHWPNLFVFLQSQVVSLISRCVSHLRGINVYLINVPIVSLAQILLNGDISSCHNGVADKPNILKISYCNQQVLFHTLLQVTFELTQLGG